MKTKFLKRVLWLMIPLLTIFTTNVWGADVTDVITASYLEATGTTYTDFSGVTITSDAVYAGQSAKDGSGNIQLRSKNSNSGIVTTASGGSRVKSVRIVVASGANTIKVYGKTTAYSAATDLYNNSTKGTEIGSTSSTATLTITGDYTFVGIRSNSGAVYISSIEITWETTAGCSGTALSTPSVTATPSSNKLVLSWPNVDNATKYQVSWNGGAYADATSPFTKNSLSNGTTYTWAVKAIGDGSTWCNSEAAEGSSIPGTYYTVTFMNNGSTYDTKSIRSGQNLVLPDAPSSCDPAKEFVGWATAAIVGSTNTKPTFVSSLTTIGSAQTYYAVFATKTANKYELGAKADLIDGRQVLIVNPSANKAMSGTASSSGKLGGVDVTISSSTITKNDATIIWTVGIKNGYYQFKRDNKFLNSTGNNAYCDSDEDTWSVTVNSNKNILRSQNSSKDLECYNGNFYCYNTGTSDYYKMDIYIPEYKNYVTSCAACAADPTEGSAALKGGFSLSSVGVTATGWDAGTNCAWEDYGFVWGTSANPTVSDNKVPVGNSGTATTWDGTLTGSFTVGTTYYFRAYGKNGKDGGAVQYSDDATFTPRQVNFNMHGHGGDAPASQVVNNGGKATDPGNPSEAGWTFGGWYDNEGCTGSAWNFTSNTVSGANVTLYAKWTEKPKYTITLNAGNGTISDVNWTNTSGSTYTRTQSNGDEAITLPTPSCGCAGWVFKGWSTTSKDNAGSFTPDKTDGASFTPTSDVTYYAVYRQSTPSGTTYTKITESAAFTTGDYLIVANNDGGSYYYSMGNSITSSHMTETSSTNSTSWSNPSADYVWTVIKFGDKVGFYNASADNNNGKYLTIVDGAWVLADDGQLFSYSFNSTTKAWTFTSPSGKQMVYTSYFYTGDAQDDPIYLYKRGDAESGNYYTNPSCSDYSVTGVANPAAGGSVQLTAAAAKNGDKVWACYTADPEYNFTNWSISGTSVSPTSATTQFVEITVGFGDVTATANFSAKVMYNVTWKANGDALTGEDLGSASVRVENGHNITTLPPAPTSCETGSGKSDVFMGWCNMDWSGYKDDPEHFPVGAVLYASASEMPAVTGDVTYHAVWAQAGTTPVSYTLDFAISNSVGSATAFTAFKTGLTNAATNNTYWDADNITTSGIIYQDANASGQVGPRFGSGSNTGTIVMPLLAAGQVVPTSIAASVKRYGSDAAVKFKIKAHFTDATEVETELPSSGYVAADFTTYTATYSNGKTLDKITIYTTTSSQRMYLASITVTANAMTKYLTKCCTTPTLAFAASPYATIRQDIHGASSSTWAEVDVTFTTNSSGTISVPDYGSGKSVYKLSWEGRGTTGGTLCTTDHAYFELGETPGTGTLHVKTTTGYTGQGTYRIAITQAATDAEHGNYCEATVYGFVDVTLRDKFVDNVNDNEGPVNKDGHGAQVATPTLSEFGTQVENACHSEGRKLKGWIKETDLQTLYENGTPASTRVQTIDGLCESCSAGSDETSLIKAPGTNITTSGATWYAVWAYER